MEGKEEIHSGLGLGIVSVYNTLCSMNMPPPPTYALVVIHLFVRIYSAVLSPNPAQCEPGFFFGFGLSWRRVEVSELVG